MPPPELLDDWASWARRSGATPAPITQVPRPFDLRFITPPIWASSVRRRTGPPVRDQLWMRADGVLPDDDLLHICVLAYASDLTLLWSVGAAHGHTLGQDVMAASLDHAMWFHRPFRADDWVLCDYTSPSAAGGRGLATGRFFSRDGKLIANVVQEGLLRLPR